MESLVPRNLMEEVVDNLLDECIKKAGACSCTQCRADIRAYALNHLPPKYVVSTRGNIFSRVNTIASQSRADIITAILQGIKLLSDKPRHDDTGQSI